MLITFGQLNTVHYGGTWTGGVDQDQDQPGVLALLSHPPAHACWVLTGLLGVWSCIAGLQEITFLSQGFSGGLLFMAIIRGTWKLGWNTPPPPQVTSCAVGGGWRIRGGPSPHSVGQQKCWAVSRGFCEEQFNAPLLHKDLRVEKNIFFSFVLLKPPVTSNLFLFSLIRTREIQFLRSPDEDDPSRNEA